MTTPFLLEVTMKRERSPVGKFLRGVRDKKREIQQEVAERMGVTKSQISHLETSTRNVSNINLEKVTKGYQLNNSEEEQLKDLIGLKSNFNKLQGIDVFYQLLQLPLEVRQRIAKAVIAYDSLELVEKKK